MKYYGTFGPSCNEKDMLSSLLKLGMTGMRLNLSHSGLAQCKTWLDNYKIAQEETGESADLLIDLKGPELRIGKMEKSVHVQKNDVLFLEAMRETPEPAAIKSILLHGEKSVREKRVASYKIPFPFVVLQAITEGQEVLLNDGTVRAMVTEVNKDGTEVCQAICIATCEGDVSSGKSIALPGLNLELPTLAADDLENLSHAAEFGVTEVMLPFVRGKQDVENLRSTLREMNLEDILILAKIENMDGVHALDEIIPEADTIVIARGDLGNALPLWELPRLQKEIAAKCREKKKDFMVVTQLLHSMHTAPVPTRAEVSDIYNAVLDGASSLMLTGETAAGKYPLEAMEYLIRTAEA